jgi:hypothetical protein
MKHKRSEEAVQKRLLKMRVHSLIFEASFHDNIRCETVSRLSRADVLSLLNGPVKVSDVPDIVKGEVLVDSRGQGSFQR